jgi:plastocyanin
LCPRAFGRRARGRWRRRRLAVATQDDEFEPDVLRLQAGTEVQVEVRNEGSQGHNFTIDSLDLSTGTVEPGSVVAAAFTVPNGTTEFHCTFHPGMTGEIVAT